MSLNINYSGGVFSAPQAKSVGTVTAGTGPYNLASASYDSVSFSVATQDDNPRSVAFSSDGSKMFMLGTTGDSVYQYSLSTAWNPSSATYDSVSFSVGTQETNSGSIIFKSDGTSFYVIGYTNSVFQYDLTTAYDLSTASYASKSLSTGLTNAVGLSISTDGTKLWASDVGGTIQQFTMSTAWDVSTASSDSKSLDVSARGATTTAIYVSPDGSAVYITNLGTDTIYEYDLSTAYDISTGTYNSVSFSVATQETNPWGFTFKDDGSKMYLIGNIGDTVYQYSTVSATTLDLSTGNYFSHTPSVNTLFAFNNPPASGTAAGFALALTGANAAETYDIANLSYDNVNFSVASQETNPTGIQFKPDGTKMYITGNTTNDAVYEYDLSTAWDVSTASYNQNFSFTVTGTNPQDLFFKPDGTKMFIVEGANATIDEYNLSTAWDISTASYSQSGSTTGETEPRSLFFKPDGTRMFVGGRQGDDITQYDLSTAWDVSTASGAGTFYVAAKEANPFGFAFNNDGTTFYVTGSNGAIQEYNVQSAAYSVVNGQFVRTKYINGSGQTSNPTGLAFKDDGTKVYSIGNTNDRVAQFSTGSTAAATFTYPSSVKFPNGTAPAGPAIGETDVLVFYTDDGGTTYQGFRAGNEMS